MTNLDRALSGDLMRFDLDEEVRTASGEEGGARKSRTLVKQGPLRCTVVSLDPGEATSPHSVPGPVIVQGLRGRVTMHAGGETEEIGPADLVSLGPGVEHRVSSAEGGVVLLTLVHLE